VSFSSRSALSSPRGWDARRTCLAIASTSSKVARLGDHGSWVSAARVQNGPSFSPDVIHCAPFRTCAVLLLALSGTRTSRTRKPRR
jgi:hypothetical protein